MICSENGERREEIVKPCCAVVIVPGFQVHSALYGDGKERYADVTTTVQEWVSKEWWPDNWEEILYAMRKPRDIGSSTRVTVAGSGVDGGIADNGSNLTAVEVGLKIHSAVYGVGGDLHGQSIGVVGRVRELVKDNSLDIIVNNSTLTPGENPFRGKKKRLLVRYSFDGGEVVEIARDEKDWLIIGPAVMNAEKSVVATFGDEPVRESDAEHQLGLATATLSGEADVEVLSRDVPTVEIQEAVKKLVQPMTPAALNDYLIRRFSISPQRLRGPMPIELRDFHRNDLAQLFAELGFKRGAEIGVAEGNYSEVLLKANPECELLLVDPWHHYSDNPQGKSEEKHTYAFNEMMRKTEGYEGRRVHARYSMDVVRDVQESSLDFVYIDGNHLFDYVMQDLIEWSKRVHSGGIVSGDDYYALDQKRWVGGGVVEAVQAYVNAHRIPIWYIFQGHKSTDFMWVKPWQQRVR